MANNLGLDPSRIDFSAVVNKYIGETKNNPPRLVDTVIGRDAILFDAAKALWCKPSEV
jgi:hypothetical protein